MNLSDQLAYIFNYSQQCVALPIRTFYCLDFWFYCLVSFVALCLLIIFLLIRRLLKDKAVMLAYQKRKLSRSAVADDRTMKMHKWQSDSEFDYIDQSALANQMRENLRQRTKTNYNI